MIDISSIIVYYPTTFELELCSAKLLRRSMIIVYFHNNIPFNKNIIVLIFLNTRYLKAQDEFLMFFNKLQQLAVI